MPNPIVIAHHLIWTAYGCWLPNDPRGSGSHHVASAAIAELGELHHGRKKVQPAGRDIRAFSARAREVLLFPLLTFDAEARRAIGEAFGAAVSAERYTCYACAVMPDHVHVLIRKHKHTAEEMIDRLQQSSRDLLAELQHRTTDHPTWCESGGMRSSITPTTSAERSHTSRRTHSRYDYLGSTGPLLRSTTAGLCIPGTVPTLLM